MRRALMVLSVLLVGTIAWVFGRLADEPAAVEIAQLADSNWEQLVPQGKEVDAILGDYVLRNEHLTAVIAQPLITRHANMTVRDVGGCLIDLTARPHESDQLSAFYPSARRFPFREAIARGNDGQTIDLVKTSIAKSSVGDIVVAAEASEGRPRVEVTYRLAAGQRYLTVISKFINNGENPVLVPLTDDFRLDHGKEDVVKAADGEADWYWIHDVHWQQAYGWFVEKATIVANGNARGAAFQYAMPDNKPSVTI